jgi:hypothetical protein
VATQPRACPFEHPLDLGKASHKYGRAKVRSGEIEAPEPCGLGKLTNLEPAGIHIPQSDIVAIDHASLIESIDHALIIEQELFVGMLAVDENKSVR